MTEEILRESLKGIIWVWILCFCAGCTVIKKDSAGKRELEFSVVEEDEVPDEMREMIEEEKEQPFRLTWGDGDSLYIGQGYGEKPMDGYQIQVDSCFETDDAIYIHTTLKGPPHGEKINEKSTFPYGVVKVKGSGKQVVFQGN